jgi:hypothetical protein
MSLCRRLDSKKIFSLSSSTSHKFEIFFVKGPLVSTFEQQHFRGVCQSETFKLGCKTSTMVTTRQ